MSDTSLLDGKKILVVDDEPDVLEVLAELLDMCEVVTASTFEQAKELLEARSFDIAILDIMGVDGYGLLSIAKRRRIPAVMLTAHAFTPRNLIRTIKEGGCAYIPKEEMSGIAGYLVDVLKAVASGNNPWDSWQNRQLTSYFEKRWGATWADADKEFWANFKAGLKARRSGPKGSDQ